MVVKRRQVNYVANGRAVKCILLIILIILNLNGSILSKEKQKDKMEFEQDTSYHPTQGKKIKVPPGGRFSKKGDFYLFKPGDKELTCVKISEGENEKKVLWTRKFDGKIKEFRIEPIIGDSVSIVTEKGTLRGEIYKGNFSYTTIKEKKMQGISHSPEGKNYAASKGKGLIFGNRETGNVSLRIPNAHKKKIKFFDFISRDRLLTIGGDNVIKVWNRNKREEIMNRKVHPSRIKAATLTFDRKYLVIGTYDFKIGIGIRAGARPSDVKERFRLKIIDTSDLSIIKEIDGTTNNIRKISVSADNKFAAVLKDDNTVDVWDLENAYIIRSFSGEKYSDAGFGPLGETFILVTQKGTVQRWITRGVVVESTRPQYVGEKYKINTSTAPIITKLQSGISIAILDFSGLLIDSQVAEAISYSFRNRISNYSYIHVVEREEMDKVLNEQGVQNSGVTSPEKAAEIGKILNAKKLVMGKLTRLGSTLIATIKVVDVESARIEGGRELECQNYALENIPEMVDILLNILIEK